MPKVFISYSWDSEEHKKWVKELSIQLINDGINVSLDKWDCIPGDQIPKYMERSVRESDFVLIICTPKYKYRSDNRIGGVGYEGDVMNAEVFNYKNDRKFIPILRIRPWENSAPLWLLGKYYIDLSSSQNQEKLIEQYNELINTLKGTREKSPEIVKQSNFQEYPIDNELIVKEGIFPVQFFFSFQKDHSGQNITVFKIDLNRIPLKKWIDLFFKYIYSTKTNGNIEKIYFKDDYVLLVMKNLKIKDINQFIGEITFVFINANRNLK